MSSLSIRYPQYCGQLKKSSKLILKEHTLDGYLIYRSVSSPIEKSRKANLSLVSCNHPENFA